MKTPSRESRNGVKAFGQIFERAVEFALVPTYSGSYIFDSTLCQVCSFREQRVGFATLEAHLNRLWLAALALLISSTSMAAGGWDLNDVSILLPLPTTSESGALARASDAGDKGELLPWAVVEGFDTLFHRRDQRVTYSELRALGIRIDPCFKEKGVCHRQIRLVWQPVLTNGNEITTLDTAVHSFYELTAEEFAQALVDLEALERESGVRTASLPLGVHPAAKAQGVSGRYVAGVRSFLLKFAGQKNLTRATAMFTRGPGNILWGFSGVDIVEGKPQVMIVPRTGNRTLQTFVNRSMPGTDYDRPVITPDLAPGEDVLEWLLGDTPVLRDAREADIVEDMISAAKIQNPNFHSPETMDCVSCHTSGPSLALGLRMFPTLKDKAEGFTFQSSFDLSNHTVHKDHTRNLRAFGYFGNEPAFSQRLINESAAIAEALNQGQR